MTSTTQPIANVQPQQKKRAPRIWHASGALPMSAGCPVRPREAQSIYAGPRARTLRNLRVSSALSRPDCGVSPVAAVRMTKAVNFWLPAQRAPGPQASPPGAFLVLNVLESVGGLGYAAV